MSVYLVQHYFGTKRTCSSARSTSNPLQSVSASSMRISAGSECTRVVVVLDRDQVAVERCNSAAYR
jgi:hypothetical protein